MASALSSEEVAGPRRRVTAVLFITTIMDLAALRDTRVEIREPIASWYLRPKTTPEIPIAVYRPWNLSRLPVIEQASRIASAQRIVADVCVRMIQGVDPEALSRQGELF